MNKRGITPLLATFLLIIFAMVLGSVVMSFGKEYIDTVPKLEEKPVQICMTDVDVSPLQALQIKHINGEISEQEYYDLESLMK